MSHIQSSCIHNTYTYDRETYDEFPFKILPPKKSPKHKTQISVHIQIGPNFQIEFVSRDIRKSEFFVVLDIKGVAFSMCMSETCHTCTCVVYVRHICM